MIRPFTLLGPEACRCPSGHQLCSKFVPGLFQAGLDSAAAPSFIWLLVLIFMVQVFSSLIVLVWNIWFLAPGGGLLVQGEPPPP